MQLYREAMGHGTRALCATAWRTGRGLRDGGEGESAVTAREMLVLRIEGSSNLHLKTMSTPISQTTASRTIASAKPISPLGRPMIEDMTVRGFGEKIGFTSVLHT
jgi:hypothetical protein